MNLIHLPFYRQHWADVRKCPAKRLEAVIGASIAEITTAMKENISDFYVAFAESLFGDRDIKNSDVVMELPEAESKRTEFLRRQAKADRIWSLCAKHGRSFSGYSGEVFFGLGHPGELQPAGQPVHAAYMRNLFLQTRGRRRWRLWSHRFSHFFRLRGYAGWAGGKGAHATWSASNPEAFGLNETYAKHVHAIPSLTADMGEGDS